MKKIGLINKLWALISLKEKLQMFGILGVMVGGSFLEVVGVGIIPAFILMLANPKKIFDHKIASIVLQWLNIDTPYELLVSGSIVMISIFVIKNAYLTFNNIIRANYIRKLQVKYSKEIFERYMYADFMYLVSHNTAELQRNCINEVSQVVLGVLQGFLVLFMDALLVINIIVVLIFVSPLTSILTLLLIGSIAVVFLRTTQRKLSILGTDVQTARGDIYQSVTQGLNGIKETRVLHAENVFVKAFTNAQTMMSQAQKTLTIITGSIKPVFETIAVIALLMITFVIYWQKKSMESVIPLLSIFSIAMIRILPAVKEITSTISNLRFSIVSVNPVYDSLFVSSYYDRFSTNNEEKIEFTDSISLNNISFNYPNSEEQAVDQVSLQIKKGSVIAFAGSSGAGKTTLADILTGLLRPTEGHISVDGVDITDKMRSWQKHLGYIPQFIYLADDTVENNVLWGYKNEGEEIQKRFDAALESAQLTEFIRQLPNGIKTIIGERGTRLSGGQRQRIGIARALFRDPDVLIMDEATAALDNITEKNITASIDYMKGNRTVVIIAHRLSTIRNCDVIYLMSRGKIIAQGDYDTLLETSEEFRALHKALEKDIDQEGHEN